MFYRGLDRERACTRLTKTVDRHDGAVIVLVGGAQLGRHGEFVVKVGKRAVWIFRSGIQNLLHGLLNLQLHFICGDAAGKFVTRFPKGIRVHKAGIYQTSNGLIWKKIDGEYWIARADIYGTALLKM